MFYQAKASEGLNMYVLLEIVYTVDTASDLIRLFNFKNSAVLFLRWKVNMLQLNQDTNFE